MVLLGALPRNIVTEIKFSINTCKVSPKIKARYDHSQLHFIGHRTDNLFKVVYQINPQLGTGTTILFLKVSNACYNKASENPCQMETAHGLFGFRYRAMKCYGVEALNG